MYATNTGFKIFGECTDKLIINNYKAVYILIF